MEFYKELDMRSIWSLTAEYQREKCWIQDEIDALISKITAIAKELNMQSVYVHYVTSHEGTDHERYMYKGYVVALTTDKRWFFCREDNTAWYKEHGGIVKFTNMNGSGSISDDSHEVTLTDIMQEFDFAGKYVASLPNGSQTVCCINDIKHRMRYVPNIPTSFMSLKRINKKGYGLRNKLNTVLETLEERKRMAEWKEKGLCLKCGGKIVGLFRKRCQICGCVKVR